MSLLSLKLNETDTSFPRLVDGSYIMNIEEAIIAPGAKDPNMHNLKLTLATTDVAQDHRGQELKAGFKLARYFPIPNDQRTSENNENFMKGLTLLALAVCGLANKPENVQTLPDFDEEFISNMAGKQVLAKVRTSKPKKDAQGNEVEDEYGPKSEIASVSCIPA